MSRTYYTYILAGRTRVLYVGVTNNIVRRVMEHRAGTGSRFTRRYNVHRLVYLEWTSDVLAAIRREKQIKAWARAKKVALIEGANPAWNDLMPGAAGRHRLVPNDNSPEGSDPSLRSG